MGALDAQATPAHIPVMFAEVMDALRVRADGSYFDGTFGRGGHARGVLRQLGPDGRLLLMDKDPVAIAEAHRAFDGDARVEIRQGSFAGLADWDATAGGLDGILLDLGVSSPQLDVAERGFSFGKDGPLDMRMDTTQGQSAADWIATADERGIADVLWLHGEERMSRRIARAVVEQRAREPIVRTAALAELIARVVPRSRDGIHPATRSFQAIRIHVNRELDDLETGLDAAHARLAADGRLAVISFHSLEDRIVKQFLALRSTSAPRPSRHAPEVRPTHDAVFRPLTHRPLTPQRRELESNPRARSARLRAAVRIAA